MNAKTIAVWLVRNPYLIVLIVCLYVLSMFGGHLSASTTGEFTNRIYQPDASQVCATDYLTTNVRITFDEDVYFNIYRIITDEGGHVVFAEPGQPTHSIRLQGEDLERNLSYYVPDLAPGMYQYRVALVAENHDPAIFLIPFEVIDCP